MGNACCGCCPAAPCGTGGAVGGPMGPEDPWAEAEGPEVASSSGNCSLPPSSWLPGPLENNGSQVRHAVLCLLSERRWRRVRLPQCNFLRQVDGRLDLDFKKGGDLLAPLARRSVGGAALTRGGQQAHPRGRLGQRGDALLPQVLQLQLLLASVLLLRVDDLAGEVRHQLQPAAPPPHQINVGPEQV